MKTLWNYLIVAVTATLGAILPGAVWADSSCLTDQSNQKVLTIEKPVVLHQKETIIERRVLVDRCRRAYAPIRRIVVCAPRPRVLHRTAMVQRTVYKTVEKPVVIEKPVMIERVVEKPVIAEPVCERTPTVLIEREIEAPIVVPPAVIGAPFRRAHHLLDFELF